jgi:hypothetical protein
MFDVLNAPLAAFKHLPRNVIAKRLANGKLAFYFNVQSIYRKLGCPVPNEALGDDYQTACGSDGNGGRAAALNARLDEWHTIRRGLPVTGDDVCTAKCPLMTRSGHRDPHQKIRLVP